MNQLARNLAKNIREGSGKHGLTEDQLYEIFSAGPDVEQLAYSLRKCFEHSGKEAFSTQPISQVIPNLQSFTKWYQIDTKWDDTWEIGKNQPGCYIYGLYENGAPTTADFLAPEVFYIGESRAITRGCMLGRRTDFKGTVRNKRLSPYGCGTTFKEQFGKDKIDFVYQAYLPMHPGLCKDTELELLTQYYEKYNKIPVCNPSLDLSRVQRHISART